MTFKHVLLIAFGGAAGAVARFAVSAGCQEWFGPRFPWGTLAVNVIGCFALGWLTQVLSTTPWVTEGLAAALGTGFLGAFTTFSTFGVQTVQAWQRDPLLGAANVFANVVLGVSAAIAGMVAATKLYGGP